jgi:serine/threonine-protein kinase
LEEAGDAPPAFSGVYIAVSDTFPISFGRYQLVERLAVGGMAEVFLAQVGGAHGFAKTVAIKRILPQLSSDDYFTDLFVNEAKISARLSHPKIAQTYELGKCDGQLYIAMEYVDGLDMLAVLREYAGRQRLLPIELSVYVAHEVLDALDFAHNQLDAEGAPLCIVHRDISPSNVLASRRGDIKLVDFGIAHCEEEPERTRAGTLKGKYGYMSPEQIVGDPVDGRSDVFSAGVLLAEMLMGRRLFAAAAELEVLLMVRDVNLQRLDRFGRHIPAELDALLRRALQKDPADRFPGAASFRDALDQWLFEQRKRVTPRDVAAVVEELYEQVHGRRRARGSGSVTIPPRSRDIGVALARNQPVDDSLEPEIEVELSQREALAQLVGAPPAAVRGLRYERPRPGPAHGSADGIPIFVDDTPGDDLGDLIIEEATPTGDLVTGDSLRFPSIADAVNSLALQEPDPATRDFDGSQVSAADRGRSRGRFTIPPAETAAPVGAAAQSGELSDCSSLRLIYRLAVARSTGLLVISCDDMRKEIFISAGVPIFVSSNVLRERLGQYLLQQGIVSEGELAMALAVMPHYGGKLGDTLVGLGLMKPLDVFRLLTRQVREKLIDVCCWPRGAYAWYPGRAPSADAFPLDLDPFEVLGAAALVLPDGRIQAWLREVGRLRLRSTMRNAIPVERFRIGTAARDAYDALRGSSTVAEMVARFDEPVARGRFVRILHLFWEAELIGAGGD